MSANDPNVRINIDTALTGTGAVDGAKQLDNLGDKATEAGRSMDRMESEVRELEKALRTLDPSTLEFQRTAEDLGRVRKELQLTADRADEFARRSGGAVSGGKNLGGAFLEVARAAEDAQYGISGIVNNVPGIVAMFGGPAGLAAGVSLAAVALNLFVKNLGKAKDEAAQKEAFEDMGEQIVALGEKFKEFYRGRNNAPDSIAAAFDADSEAINKQTDAVVRNIERMKERIELAGRLREADLKNEIERIEGQEQRGEIKPEDGAKKRDEIEQKMHRESIQRLAILGELDVKVFEEKKKAAELELEAAKSAKAAADKQVEQVNQLKATVDTVEAALKAAEELQKLQEAGGREAGRVFEPVMDIEARRRRMDALEPDIEAAGFDGKLGANPELVKILQDRLNKAQEELNKLAPNVEGVSEALRAATEKLENAKRDLEDAGARTEGNNDLRDREDLGLDLERLNRDMEAAGEKAGDEISAIFETWVAALGNNAEGSKAKELIEMVREKLADGIQEGELEQILNTAKDIASKVNRVTTTSAQAFGSLGNAIANHEARMLKMLKDIRDLEEIVKKGATQK